MSVLYRQMGESQVAHWRVWSEQNDDGTAWLCTEYGIVGGAVRQSRREITEKGRESSTYGKAQQQALKKWEDKQSKEGYSPEKPAEIRKKAKLEQPAEPTETLAAATEQTNEPILPMLANKAEFNRDKGLIKGMAFPVCVQPKIDGFRCITSLKPRDVSIFSRTNVPYIGFQSLRDALCKCILPLNGFGSGRLFLDGELFLSDVNFNTLSGLIKRGQHHADYDLPNLQYIIFDCFDLDHMDVTFAERYAFLKSMFASYISRISVLSNLKARTLADVDAYMRTFIAEGHEGLMLRDPDSPYVLRKRSKYLLKHKEFQDEEFTIIGFKEGNGDDKGTVVWLCATSDGMSFYVRPKGTREFRSDLYKNASDYIGKELTVTFQEKSADGIPRFPVGRAVRDAI